MPSQEAKILGDFLLAPAPLRDFITLRDFTDIFPRAHRSNPAVQEIYRELQRIRDKDVELVRQDIIDEVKRSKQLRREYAREKRQIDDATVAGLDPVALQMEEEVARYTKETTATRADLIARFPAKFVRNRTPYRRSTPTSTKRAKALRLGLQR
jgi:hypothetical protein